MVGILLDYYFYQKSYSSLKSKNVAKFCVHNSPIFSCRVTYIRIYMCVYNVCTFVHSCTVNDKTLSFANFPISPILILIIKSDKIDQTLCHQTDLNADSPNFSHAELLSFIVLVAIRLGSKYIA